MFSPLELWRSDEVWRVADRVYRCVFKRVLPLNKLHEELVESQISNEHNYMNNLVSTSGKQSQLRDSPGNKEWITCHVVCVKHGYTLSNQQRTETRQYTGQWSEYGAVSELKGRGNGRSPRKPANELHHPARFPHAKIRERPGRVLNLVHFGERRRQHKISPLLTARILRLFCREGMFTTRASATDSRANDPNLQLVRNTTSEQCVDKATQTYRVEGKMGCRQYVFKKPTQRIPNRESKHLQTALRPECSVTLQPPASWEGTVALLGSHMQQTVLTPAVTGGPRTKPVAREVCETPFYKSAKTVLQPLSAFTRHSMQQPVAFWLVSTVAVATSELKCFGTQLVPEIFSRKTATPTYKLGDSIKLDSKSYVEICRCLLFIGCLLPQAELTVLFEPATRTEATSVFHIGCESCRVCQMAKGPITYENSLLSSALLATLGGGLSLTPHCQLALWSAMRADRLRCTRSPAPLTNLSRQNYSPRVATPTTPPTFPHLTPARSNSPCSYYSCNTTPTS
ncbi:hypothetical protein PR048_018831 [Dryococelus australis]|uniref:Uncharacterized protein n=1 Tax=Dryococelus australis TaxID=614101 RepID=A0ABQ9H1V3_9NEOP|nr:hypothetical protein PR048_018831 [Dryococelus australis]